MDGLPTLSVAEWDLLGDGLSLLPENLLEEPPRLAGAGIPEEEKKKGINDPQRIATWAPEIKRRFVELCKLRVGEEKRGENSSFIIKTIEKEFDMKLLANRVHIHRHYINGLTPEQLEAFVSRQTVVKKVYRKLVGPNELFKTKLQMEIFANGCEEWLKKGRAEMGQQRKVTSALQVALAKEGLEVSGPWILSHRRMHCSSIEKIKTFRDKIGFIFPETHVEKPSRKRKRPLEEKEGIYNHPHHSTSWERHIKERFVQVCREKKEKGKRGKHGERLQRVMEEEFGLVMSLGRICSQRQHILEYSDKELSVWLDRPPMSVPSSYRLEIRTPAGVHMNKSQLEIFADGCERRLKVTHPAVRATIVREMQSSLAAEGLDLTIQWIVNKIKYYGSRLECIDELRESAGALKGLP